MSKKPENTAAPAAVELSDDALDQVVGGVAGSSQPNVGFKDSGEAHLDYLKKQGKGGAYYDGAGNHVRGKDDGKNIILYEETEHI